ncbi:uncharacterized protein LOC121735326 [Aricia agestis]|uniref:uncharacterized protein LOC121735326 n=1 Tax=Aricia agestis TaxID=91739 RepID=UPI001C209293|nr:uncharacterized protein LOC121735326 [Aricia agestis]
MRSILLLALLLYNILANTANYDYEDVDADKRHSSLNARRDWRKRVLNKPAHAGWNNRMYDERHHDHDRSAMMNREKEMEYSNRGIHYERGNLESRPKDAEMIQNVGHKMEETKAHHDITMNCARPNERYEACFAGCAAVSCDNPHDRLRPCYPFCESGCICIHPYVRDDRTHKCVLPADCTKGLKGIPDLGEEVT